MSSETTLPAEVEIPAEVLPDLDQFVIEDGKPVDSLLNEKQMRLLTQALYDSWPGPGDNRPFVVMSDVGLFYRVKQPPLAPDVMLAVDVTQGEDLTQKANRSYFTWLRGKAPDVVIEIVSDKHGSELHYKRNEYAQAGVLYYVVYDPEEWLES